MTETARMKDPIKSFDVFEFKEEDELTANKIVPKFEYPNALDFSRIAMKSKEIDISICKGANANVDTDAASPDSFAPFVTGDFAKETPELNHVLDSNLKIRDQAGEIKSKIIEPWSVFASVECGSTIGAAVQLEDHLNDRSVQLASNADENMPERSPSFSTKNTASCYGLPSDNCGQPSANCSSDWNSEVGIVFHPDYINFCGTHYLDSVVRFSRRFVEARSKSNYGNEKAFQLHLEIEDIVKIESQWSATYEVGSISIYFISNDGVQGDLIHNASGLQQLKFPAVGSDWYLKQEAIGSLDMRYKALWNVLLDTGMEKISPLPEGEEMMPPRSYFPKFDQPFDEVIYPKGDPDAVSISKRDVDLLLPDTFVNDTIIDFYIKYLKSRQNTEARSSFHFFNSFFFRKLADMDKDPSSAFDGKAAFQRVRKWTRKINLLEKDFILIPVNYNYHWSLIVICYFGKISSCKDIEYDNTLGVPCILHMDSLRGTHAGLKDLLQSYLWEEWKERKKETSEDMHSSFRNLKFLPLELPQQTNSYDCGLFLLHYVELFLEEVPANFSVYNITPSSKFLQANWFVPVEASMKRTHIERLINDLIDNQSEDCPSGGSGMPGSSEHLNITLGHAIGVDFSVKSSLSARLEGSLQPVDPGIEITSLPASATRVTQSNGTSGMALKELFKHASGPESLSDAHWVTLETEQSLHELNRPGPLTEEANKCLGLQGLEKPVFQSMDDATPDKHVSPYSSEDFRLNLLPQPEAIECLPQEELEPVFQSMDDATQDEPISPSEDFESNSLPQAVCNIGCPSPVSDSESDDSVEVEAYPEKGQEVASLGQNDEADSYNSCSLSEKIEQSTICSDLYPAANQMHDRGPSHGELPVDPSLASGDKLDASKVVIPCDEPNPFKSGQKLVFESDDDGRTAKRIRNT